MRYTNLGVNIDGIDKLILDIYNYAEKINNTLTQISNVVEDTKNNYNSNNSIEFINKFKNLEDCFSVVNANIISYADDLIKLKNKYQILDEDLTQKVKLSISKIDIKGRNE